MRGANVHTHLRRSMAWFFEQGKGKNFGFNEEKILANFSYLCGIETSYAGQKLIGLGLERFACAADNVCAVEVGEECVRKENEEKR
jgi:hypothetical protein